jgi:biopolymer transport protein ExbD
LRLTPRDAKDRVTLPDITSMVDVVFLLIIFFLTTSSLVRATVSRVELPEQAGNAEARLEERGIVVNIDADSNYIVEGEAVELDRLLNLIAGERDKASDPSDVEILVRADRGAPLRAVNALAGGLIDLDIRGWKLATRAPAGSMPTGADASGGGG